VTRQPGCGFDASKNEGPRGDRHRTSGAAGRHGTGDHGNEYGPSPVGPSRPGRRIASLPGRCQAEAQRVAPAPGPELLEAREAPHLSLAVSDHPPGPNLALPTADGGTRLGAPEPRLRDRIRPPPALPGVSSAARFGRGRSSLTYPVARSSVRQRINA